METVESEDVLNPTNQTEVFYWKHNPQSLLVCLRVLAWYLGDGKERVTLPQYSWKMAARMLGLSGARNNWKCPHWWRKRLELYGVDPVSFTIKDQKKFGICWEMLNEYCTEGQPWKVSVSTFNDRLKEVQEGKRDWHRASIVSIPWTSTRRTRRKPGSNWRQRAKVASADRARANVFKERLAALRREYEEP